MKKYWSFFRIRFTNGLQYRAAALSGVATQFFWGMMYILMYSAFYRTNPAQFPMGFSDITSYVWLQQAFLALFMSWIFDPELISSISSGGIAYEMVRPLEVYSMWYVKEIANRASMALLRCWLILLIAFFIPQPYGLKLPESIVSFLLFLVSGVLGCLVMVSLSMIISGLTFYTTSALGLRTAARTVSDFLGGGIIAIPFLPDGFRQVVSLLPFASTQNVPLRIYSGNIAGMEALFCILLQVFWLVVLLAGGRLLFRRALKRVVVQGG
jgi:ABC-2 type transport system permease protein